ncbi:hypothetical protein CRENBAI_001396 [Crenichthys baileyi]|uniref:Uncharacterized protein n=1 Tax=Crenichthys baileyi TaxID=28760 RepID=A0AAV9QWY8_9TELE
MSSTHKKPMKTHPHSASFTHSPTPSTPDTSYPPPHRVSRGQGKGSRNTTPASARGQSHRRQHRRKATTARKARQPHTSTPKVPQHARHTHSQTAYSAAPSRAASQPLHQSEATSQSLPHSARPRHPPPEPGAPPRSDEQKYGLTPKKTSWLSTTRLCLRRRAHDQHAQPPLNTWGRAKRAPSPQCPPAWHRTAATNRQAEQQNMPHANTGAANKPHLTQNSWVTQIQAPSQNRALEGREQELHDECAGLRAEALACALWPENQLIQPSATTP